jgi:hypothetical protein
MMWVLCEHCLRAAWYDGLVGSLVALGVGGFMLYKVILRITGK